ncbi:aldo/keto reductase [Limosilactobacillus sp.]|jgi:diketogulonate reductase-like aldo/keto reductase|uniref:aldo/keto reductase n=1 Tax=Limosilactobacillus sp. TaxID=2773925 RepID=UPI0025BF5CC3|nr:aldo/keto reductase [Limosilactobacillus sp.]MCH3921873.1 aldo/keto reductase [Limosilactobacillus sp.]MCH3928644.1 aldo/keto reductase [Limosilactobacillus sp.]
MKTITLNDGLSMPQLGFCAYGISNQEVGTAVREAIRVGYRGIDTAQFNRNEAGTGQGIRASGIERSQLFVTTKVQTDGFTATKRGLDDSLRRAQLDYFDLVLIHWPMPDTLGTYRALEEARREGKVRSLGLSNFNIAQIKELLAATDVKPVVDEIETHLFSQQKKLHRFLEQHQIVHEAYAPFGENVSLMTEIPLVQWLAKKYRKAPTQIILHYLIQSQIVVNVRSTNPAHIRANLALFDFQLLSEEVAALRDLDRHQPLIDWPLTMRVDE